MMHNKETIFIIHKLLLVHMAQVVETMTNVLQRLDYNPPQKQETVYEKSTSTRLRDTYQLEVRKGQDKHYIVRCRELHVVAQGKTINDAVIDALNFMESVLEESGKNKAFSIRIIRK